jgi:hypothetical protein
MSFGGGRLLQALLDPAKEPTCATCAPLKRQLLNIMQEHLQAECDLYNAAFVLKDARLAHEHNLRAVELLQRSSVVMAQLEVHVRREHGEGEGLGVIGEATQS